MKHIVVLLTENNARILKVSDASSYLRATNCLVNPDLKKVEGIPPHFWKMSAGEIIPMNEDERREREAHIATNGIINHTSLKFREEVQIPKKASIFDKIKKFILGK